MEEKKARYLAGFDNHDVGLDCSVGSADSVAIVRRRNLAKRDPIVASLSIRHSIGSNLNDQIQKYKQTCL